LVRSRSNPPYLLSGGVAIKKLKVYRGLTYRSGGDRLLEIPTIIGAYNRKQVAEITGNSVYIIGRYWGTGGNERDMELATKRPLTMIYPDDEQ